MIATRLVASLVADRGAGIQTQHAGADRVGLRRPQERDRAKPGASGTGRTA